MKAVIQRVSKAHVTVKDKLISEIGNGLMILIGIKKGNKENHAKELAEKCANLRIFEDSNTAHGRRPSFTDAEGPVNAKKLYEYFISTLNSLGITTKGGIFGERMLVSLENRGPVTIIMEE